MPRHLSHPLTGEAPDMLSQQMDTVLDLIEEVMQKLYIYNVKSIEPAAIDYAKNIVKACEHVSECVGSIVMKNT